MREVIGRDTLFLLPRDFEDPAYPEQVFFCWHCVLLHGLLTSFPEHASKIDVETVAWPRPRQRLVDLCGEANQSLPVLLLADGGTSRHQTGTCRGRVFISDKDGILAALAERHGFPNPHL